MIIQETDAQVIIKSNASTVTLGEDLIDIYVFLPSIFLRNYLIVFDNFWWRRFCKWISGCMFFLKNKSKEIL